MRNVLTIVALIACASICGCSTAGPFVTDVWSDGQGNLIVEKNTVRMSSLLRRIYNGNDLTKTTIRIVP